MQLVAGPRELGLELRDPAQRLRQRALTLPRGLLLHLFRRRPGGEHLHLARAVPVYGHPFAAQLIGVAVDLDRKSTRLNSSHGYISYAVFCLKKKKKS